MKRNFSVFLSLFPVLLFYAQSGIASSYVIDTEGGHAFIQFRISHLGYSVLAGRFNKFSGEFVYDTSNPSKASVSVLVETASIDSNHAERDKHLRDDDFLAVKQFPEARFVSSSYLERKDGTGLLKGNLTLRGVTRPIEIEVEHVGAGSDPWGGYRRGFTGKTRLVLADFGITKYLGDAAKEMELILGIEGIRNKSQRGSRKPR
ncbi:MAG: YceI family protein [Candidatus Thiodiazotropha lotti]|nr:YceI family protein [Candidatus Thiodiazotropha lotti]